MIALDYIDRNKVIKTVIMSMLRGKTHFIIKISVGHVCYIFFNDYIYIFEI